MTSRNLRNVIYECPLSTFQGPTFTAPLKEPKDLDLLEPEGAVTRLNYVFDAITLTRKKLEGKVPLIGFTGAPVRNFRSQINISIFKDLFLKLRFAKVEIL